MLIDEAAQASEVAALQPLMHGAADAVLVGDPQQLPATLFSAGAREAAMERSLFERLAAGGCEVRAARARAGQHGPHERFAGDPRGVGLSP